ncbi:proprotein convertase P-domain-containing protein [Pseudonocardia sp. TMWB2A]|uniref:proprotein convertase P-domain-containing protein n=1 Tax=Pseudonocardia sp. TMWB2A TaxID=687430 RepID=UPI00307EB0F5
MILCAFGPALSSAAHAQTQSYPNISAGGFNQNCPAAPLIRTFSVTASGTVSDINIGLLIETNFRQDMTVTLKSPAGTTVQLVSGVGQNEDNFNALLDDSAAQPVSAYIMHEGSLSAPPYAANYRPASPLASFNGQNAQGQWSLSLCDSTSRGTSTFRGADLYVTVAQTPDMSMNKSVAPVTGQFLGDFMIPGNDILYTITVSNHGAGSPDNDSVFLIDKVPYRLTYFHGDADGNGPRIHPVLFSGTRSGLSFDYNRDVRFSDGLSAPTGLSQCTYKPVSGYDPRVRFICINPKGVQNPQNGGTASRFIITFRARIN